MLRAAAVTTILGALVLSACTVPEGREPGQCSDHADNDADGVYDCDDPDCAGSPDCDPERQEEEEPTDPCATYDFDAFYADYIDAICHKLEDCGLLSAHLTLEECLALSQGGPYDTGRPWECMDFDCSAAGSCVTTCRTVSCDDLVAGQGLQACERVCSNW